MADECEAGVGGVDFGEKEICTEVGSSGSEQRGTDQEEDKVAEIVVANAVVYKDAVVITAGDTDSADAAVF